MKVEIAKPEQEQASKRVIAPWLAGESLKTKDAFRPALNWDGSEVPSKGQMEHPLEVDRPAPIGAETVINEAIRLSQRPQT